MKKKNIPFYRKNSIVKQFDSPFEKLTKKKQRHLNGLKFPRAFHNVQSCVDSRRWLPPRTERLSRNTKRKKTKERG